MTSTPTKASPAVRKTSSTKNQSQELSSQSSFTTSKLIQNLGSNQGIQFNFSNGLRTVHGRD